MGTSTSPVREVTRKIGVPIPLNTLSEPGAYICNWSGHLMRVQPEAVTATSTAALNIVGPEPLLVTKISDDPRVPTPRAKALADELELTANF